MIKPFNKKTTGWIGLWYHNDTHSWSSSVLNLSALKEFEGSVRLYMRKNKFFEKDSNRPNYIFAITDCDSQRFIQDVEVIDDKWDREEWRKLYNRNGEYIDDKGNRFYSEDEAMAIIHGVIRDVKCGYTDLIPEDYV